MNEQPTVSSAALQQTSGKHPRCGHGNAPLAAELKTVRVARFTVADRNGHLLAAYAAATRLEVARKVVAEPSDAFRLEVSASYRELFERNLRRTLSREGWRIVRLRAGSDARRGVGQASS
jgi:hypothetical protein